MVRDLFGLINPYRGSYTTSTEIIPTIPYYEHRRDSEVQWETGSTLPSVLSNAAVRLLPFSKMAYLIQAPPTAGAICPGASVLFFL